MNEKPKPRRHTIHVSDEAILGRLDLLRKHYKDEDPAVKNDGRGKRKNPLATYTYVIAKMFERNDILGIEVKHLKKEIASLKEQVAFFKR